MSNRRSFESIAAAVALVFTATRVDGVVLGGTTVDLANLVPKETQGENGVRVQVRGTTAPEVARFFDMSRDGLPGRWIYDFGGDIEGEVELGDEATLTTSGLLETPASVRMPTSPTGLFESLLRIRIDLEPGFDAVQISGSSLHYLESPPITNQSSVAFIFVNESGHDDPVWFGVDFSSSANRFIRFDETIPWTSGQELFIGVSSGADGVQEQFLYSAVGLRAVPEPSIFTMVLAGAALVVRRRSCV